MRLSSPTNLQRFTERYRPAEHDVARDVDLAHSSAAELAPDLVPPRRSRRFVTSMLTVFKPGGSEEICTASESLRCFRPPVPQMDPCVVAHPAIAPQKLRLFPRKSRSRRRETVADSP